MTKWKTVGDLRRHLASFADSDEVRVAISTFDKYHEGQIIGSTVEPHRPHIVVLNVEEDAPS